MKDSNLSYSFDFNDINYEMVHSFLRESYWGRNYDYEKYKEALKSCIVISLFMDSEQIGFGRIVTDGYLVGYLADVLILDKYQGHDYGSYMLETLFNSSEVKSINRITLSTKDQHDLYKKFGFRDLRYPENQMERIL